MKRFDLISFSAFVFLPLVAGAQEIQPAPVSVVEVVKTNIVPTVLVTGTIYSRNDVQITIGVDGQLEYVAEPGTVLKAGDVIARIDTLPLQLQKAEQEAQLQRAGVQLKFLSAQLERQRDLLNTNSTSRNQMERTESDRDIAASDLRIAELRIKQIEHQLSRATIKAQYHGVVIERLHREGEDVSRGVTIARVTDTENLEIRVFAPLQYSGRVSANDKLKIYAFESEFVGSVRTIIPSADMRSQTFELRINVPDEARDEWTIGQLVSVAVPMRAAKASLAVPRDALILRRDGTYVFRINDEGIAERVTIETGDSTGDLVGVSGSLNEHDRVVVRGAETLSDGRSVSIMNDESDGIISGIAND